MWWFIQRDEETGTRWVRGWAALTFAVIVAGVAFLIGNAGAGSANAGSVRAATPSQTAQDSQTAAAATAYKACMTKTQSAFSAISGLHSRLTVGMQSASYTTAVGNIKVTVDQVSAQASDPACQSVVTELNQAVNQYAGASSAWSLCTQDDSCDEGNDLQPYWNNADEHVRIASADLVALSHGSGSKPTVKPVEQDNAAEGVAKEADSAWALANLIDDSDGNLNLHAAKAQTPGINVTNNGTAYLSTAHGTGKAWFVTATSASGDKFTITDGTNAVKERTCTGTASTACSGGSW